MAEREACRSVGEFLLKELDKLMSRMVSVPRVDPLELVGVDRAWRMTTEAVERDCGCSGVAGVGGLVGEALTAYADERVGEAVLRLAEAKVKLDGLLRRCGLR